MTLVASTYTLTMGYQPNGTWYMTSKLCMVGIYITQKSMVWFKMSWPCEQC